MKEKYSAVREGRYEYKPKELDITWGKDKRYWKIDDEVAELLQVSWLEVTGKMEGWKGKQCKISFEISFEPYAFGWEDVPIFVMAKIGKQGKYMRKKFFPYKENDTEKKTLTIISSEHPNEAKTWDSQDQTLYFGLYEVFSGVWKGGLKIYKAIAEEI